MSDISYKKWSILKDICIHIDNKEIFFVELCNRIGRSNTDRYLNEVIKDLEKADIVVKRESAYGNSKILSFNIKKLFDYTEKTAVYKEFATYIHKTRPLYIDI